MEKNKNEIICGKIAACTKVESFVKRDGKASRKCVLCIESPEGSKRAITVTGDLVNWAGCLGMRVEVAYVHRVFPFARNGSTWYGNDLYAVSISSR